MEWVNMVKDLIGTLGFPIVCCGAMFWEMIQERKLHAEESEKWVTALNNNTTVQNRILEKLDMMEEK